MWIRNNPVLHRELMLNLRTAKSFFLLFVFQLLLATIVFFAWPTGSRIDFQEDSDTTSKLINFFFLGQFILATVLVPSFASGCITGEKEKRTYEMLLVSPLLPTAVVWGKIWASLTHLLLTIFASLPIVMLCLPLGGVSIYDVLGGYFAMIMLLTTFTMISVTLSSIFGRTSASLVSTYIAILPMAIIAGFFWNYFSDRGQLRLDLILSVLPVITIPTVLFLFFFTANRLLYPADIGTDGRDSVQEEKMEEEIGLYIDREAWPDRWFAPAKRTTLMENWENPIYDKEMRSEIFSQGTLMLRLLIQIGFLLSVLFMLPLYFQTEYSFLCPAYVVVFNLLIGPVFSAGTISSEREQETLDLLLTTTIQPWTIVYGKLKASLRVTFVLTFLMAWPLIVGTVLRLNIFYLQIPLTVLAFFLTIALVCLTTTSIGILCSAVCRRTTQSMVIAYGILMVLYMGPPALEFFVRSFYSTQQSMAFADWCSLFSPFSALSRLPSISSQTDLPVRPMIGELERIFDWANYRHFLGYIAVTLGLNVAALAVLVVRFKNRWMVSFDSDR